MALLEAMALNPVLAAMQAPAVRVVVREVTVNVLRVPAAAAVVRVEPKTRIVALIFGILITAPPAETPVLEQPLNLPAMALPGVAGGRVPAVAVGAWAEPATVQVAPPAVGALEPVIIGMPTTAIREV